MAENSAPQLPHIEILKEPEWQFGRKRRPYFPPRPPVPGSRPDHGRELGRGLGEAAQHVSQLANQFGVDSTLLHVFEFELVNHSAEDVLAKRFAAQVIQEVRQSKSSDGQTLYLLLVQFPSAESLAEFHRELANYEIELETDSRMTAKERQALFDGLQDIRLPSVADRTGVRLATQGFPSIETYFDVDLWHPGDRERARELIDILRKVCSDFDGQVVTHFYSDSLLLARVQGVGALGQALLDLPIVANVDLPPELSAPYSDLILHDLYDYPSLPTPSESTPIVTVIDSGVISGHPLLADWVVEERDFGTGGLSESDDHGHGTAVASLVVHGRLANSLVTGIWNPKVRVCSAKVLRKSEFGDNAVIPSSLRFEQALDEAIRHFYRTRGCRVFNISVQISESSQPMSRWRQHPWAQILDELARELDIVIVVLAGNASIPVPHGPSTRAEFQRSVLRNMLSDSYRVVSPGTAAIAVTVGSVAGSDAVAPSDPNQYGASLADAIIGVPRGAPSPFSRTGPAYMVGDRFGPVKPDVVHYGGNAALQVVAGGAPRWNSSHAYLGEPVARFSFSDGRFVTGGTGTSIAAPQVAHTAALVMSSLEGSIGRAPTANLTRAVLGAAARAPDCEGDWLGASEDETLRLIGYGLCDGIGAFGSTSSNVWLVAEDEVPKDKLVVYRLVLPPAFIETRGMRGISVALAYDPPVRNTRRKYLARTMWFEVLKGLTLEELAAVKAQVEAGNDDQLEGSSFEVPLRPSKTKLRNSTLQVRRRSWTRSPRVSIPSGQREPVFDILVGCREEFSTKDDGIQQFAIAANIWVEDSEATVYQQIRSRVRTSPIRARVEA